MYVQESCLVYGLNATLHALIIQGLLADLKSDKHWESAERLDTYRGTYTCWTRGRIFRLHSARHVRPTACGIRRIGNIKPVVAGRAARGVVHGVTRGIELS